MARYRSLCAYGVAALLLDASSALAESVSCAAATSLDGNLDIVGPCELEGAEINGDVTIFAGGSLSARDVLIRGDLDASRAFVVDLERTQIDGNVELEELVGDASSIELTAIGGDLKLAGNRSQLTIRNSDVAGATQAIDNSGGLTISGNTFSAGLDCSGNTPAPVGIANLLGDDDDKDKKKKKDDGDDGEDEEDEEEEEGEDGGDANDDEDNDGGTEENRDEQCDDLPPPPPADAPPATPPESSPPPASTPPATTTTPTTPPATTAEDDFADEGGVGSLDWPVVLLLSLLAWGGRGRRRT